MESAWRRPATGTWPDWMGEWEIRSPRPSTGPRSTSWSSTLKRGRLECRAGARRLGAHRFSDSSRSQGEGLFVGGVTLPVALAESGTDRRVRVSSCSRSLPDTGRRCSPVWRARVQLELVDRHEFQSGVVALRYRPHAGYLIPMAPAGAYRVPRRWDTPHCDVTHKPPEAASADSKLLAVPPQHAGVGVDDEPPARRVARVAADRARGWPCTRPPASQS